MTAGAYSTHQPHDHNIMGLLDLDRHGIRSLDECDSEYEADGVLLDFYISPPSKQIQTMWRRSPIPSDSDSPYAQTTSAMDVFPGLKAHLAAGRGLSLSHSPSRRDTIAFTKSLLISFAQKMSHPLFWPTVTYFYPVGNTSAVCLTENLSPDDRADVLLLACGDPRHILYTVYINDTNPLTRLRVIDITCCDVDVAILARNTLLFSLLANDRVVDKLDNLWDLFYHMLVDQTSLSMLFTQCRKLVALAESAETWRAGPYGHFLITCDAATLVELRRVWSTYLNTASFSPQQSKRLEERTINGMKKVSDDMVSQGASVTTAARSAGPLSVHVIGAVSSQFGTYWSSGITEDSTQRQRQRQKGHLSVNPTFACSIDGDNFSVQYGTDPLNGFHLAEAFTSDKFTRRHESIQPQELVRVTKGQFSRWCTSMNKRLKNNNSSSPSFVIRMFAGDALMFCQALKYVEVMWSPVTPYHVAAWKLSTITLDDRSYGRNAASPAPLSFNVIDTSNLLDHAGLLNVLVVTAPLLRKMPSATLYTEALLRTGVNPSQPILEYLCGDIATMALLLGIIPSTFLSQFTMRSNVHETLMIMMGENTKQYHERLAWKVTGYGSDHSEDVTAPPQRLYFAPEDLAGFLFRVYFNMFSEEDMESRFKLLFLPPERMLQVLQRSSGLHYNRRSFALFVHLVKTRVRTYWWRAMDMFEDLVLADERLMVGQQAYQELCCHLHLLGVYTANWMTLTSLRRDFLGNPGGTAALFRDWTLSRIPQVVTLVLVVPRDAIARLESDFAEVGTPGLQCEMQSGPGQLWFAAISATLGSLRLSGRGEHQTGVISMEEAESNVPAMQPPWRTKAPLIITFSVAASSLICFAENPCATIRLALHSSVLVAGKFVDKIGHGLAVFRTLLRNTDRVFVLAQRPVVGTSEGMRTDRHASARTGHSAVPAVSHWQEDTRDLEEAASSLLDVPRETGPASIRVQMDDMLSAAHSFTVRIDVTDPAARAVLADPKTVPTVNSSSGSNLSLDACVKIETNSFTVRFPLPVNIARAKLRVARRSSYIEVVAPLAPFHVQPERDITHRFAPLSLSANNDATPMLMSIHRLNLDCCPTFKLAEGYTELDWCDVHIRLMFSELERKRPLHNHPEPLVKGGSTSSSILTATSDTLLQVKHTLRLLLHSAAGAMLEGGTPHKVFALCDRSRGGVPYLYIVVACMRLDVGSHTVVADAFVASATPAARAALALSIAICGARDGSREVNGVPVGSIATDADEIAAWYHLLPRLTERCRTYPHKSSCTYRSRASAKHEKRQNTGDERQSQTWERESPLCNCGAGVGTEMLDEAFKPLAPYLTRAAFSPLFSVPYLKEVDEPAIKVALGTGMPCVCPESSSEHCAQAADREDRPIPIGVGDIPTCRSCGNKGSLTCSRCKRAWYCSKECQVADWKNHKKNCHAPNV